MHLSSSLFTVGYQASVILYQKQLPFINFSASTIVSICSRISRGGCMLESYTQTGALICLKFSAFTVVSIYIRISRGGCMLEFHTIQGQLSVAYFSAYTIVSTYSRISRDRCMLASYTQTWTITRYRSSISMHSPISILKVRYQASVLLYPNTDTCMFMSVISVHLPSFQFIVGYQWMVAC